jgi:hypothetical protein
MADIIECDVCVKRELRHNTGTWFRVERGGIGVFGEQDAWHCCSIACLGDLAKVISERRRRPIEWTWRRGST